MKVADDIIEAVCATHGIAREQLLQSGMRTIAVRAARKEAVLRLREQHFSARWIAGFLGVSLQSVQYHIYPATRERVKRGHERSLARTRAARAEAVYQ